MRDQEITELFWERKEQAVIESNIRYGAYCRRISHNILANKEDVEECMNVRKQLKQYLSERGYHL